MTKTLNNESYQKNVNIWLEGNYDQESKAEILNLQKNNPQELQERFSQNLSFGTGGLRGLMGVGSNRMNIYTVRAASYGLCQYVLSQGIKGSLSVVIGYDSRINSRLFAEETAKVFAQNGVKAYLFKELSPTPLVSFACRYKQCAAAIVITASHNPPAYNGFKAYWSDGAQVLPPHDIGIIEEVCKIEDPASIKVTKLDDPLIEEIDLSKVYLDEMRPLQNYAQVNAKDGKDLKVVYTNLHGSGVKIVPELLKDWGFSNVELVEEQKEPDGNFPTVAQPNPEESAAMQLGIQKLLETKAELLLGTDPDTDRVGAIARHKESAFIFDGNQIACLLLDHICQALKERQQLPENAAFVSTIVSTELFGKIAKSYGAAAFEVLTGFKYIAQKIRGWEESLEQQYIFGAEESYGYLAGTKARDKDAITACALICEAALHAKLQGKTLVDKLYEIYQKHGIHYEKLTSVKFEESLAGHQKMRKIMQELRQNPPLSINGQALLCIEDYLSGEAKNLPEQKSYKLELPSSNVLILRLADQSRIAIRPSGTEPKVKIYASLCLENAENIEEGLQILRGKAQKLLQSSKELLRA